MNFRANLPKPETKPPSRSLDRASKPTSNALYRYFPGDILLEPHRLAYDPLHTLAGSSGQGAGGASSAGSGIWDLIKPGKDDLKGVKSALEFLKFSPSDIENYVNAIGSLVNIAGGIVSVVGIVNSAKEILTKLKIFESDDFNVQQALQKIGMRMEQVYAYLEASEARGLFVEARGWREDITKARGRPVLASWSQVLDYCRASMGFEAKEQFRILFLDKRNQIIADEVQQKGTVDHTPVYVREVVKRALELSATAVVLVHNHPSGDPTPSRADIEMTKQIVSSAKNLGIVVHDHIIVGKQGHASFRGLGLI